MKRSTQIFIVVIIFLITIASTAIADDSNVDDEGPLVRWGSEEPDRGFTLLKANSTTVQYLGEICIYDNNPITELNLLDIHVYIETTNQEFSTNYSGKLSLVSSGCGGEDNSLLFQGFINFTAPLTGWGDHRSWGDVPRVFVWVQFSDDAGNSNRGLGSIDYPRTMAVRQIDSDNDGCLDGDDWAPADPHECGDNDGDGIGNNADADDDNDGWSDEDEYKCHRYTYNPSDHYIFNASSKPSDLDGDHVCDFLDYDDDNDGWDDDIEIFCGTDPYDNITIPLDTDGDWVCENLQGNDQCIGDDDRIDIDSDGIPDCVDELIDSDGDGFSDSNDRFPTNSSEWRDWDSDGIGDNLDEDDDNDGWPDSMDARPLDDSIQSDTDVYMSYAKWIVVVVVFAAIGLAIIKKEPGD